MTENLISQLKPYVTAFSAEIPLKFKHTDVVVVGGVVKNILNLHQLLEDSFEKELREEGVYVTIDDGVGELNLVLAPPAFHSYQAAFGELKTGDVILTEGRVFQLDTTHTYQGAQGKRITVDNHDQSLRVLVYNLAPVPPSKREVVLPVEEQDA